MVDAITTDEGDSVKETSDWRDGIDDEGLKEAAADFEAPTDLLKSYVELQGKPTNDNGVDWRDAITDEALRKGADKFTNIEALMQSYAELEGRLGKSVLLLGEDASEDDISAYRKQLGVPEDADGYELTIPEGYAPTEADIAFRAWAGEVFHDIGLPARQGKELSERWNVFAGEMQEAQNVAHVAAREKADDKLKRDWGADHARNVEFGRRAASKFGGEDLVDLLTHTMVDGVQLGNHPKFVQFSAKIGRLTEEGHSIMGLSDDQAKTTQDRIDELHELQGGDPNKYKSGSVQAELNSLYDKLHGTQPVVGAGGRTI